MRLYFYCIFRDKLKESFPGQGVAGQVVTHINNNGLCAAVSPTRFPSHRATDENLIQHEKIINFYAEKCSILPFRFNTVVGETIGRGVLKKYYKEICGDLDRISGKVQFLLQVVQKKQDRMNLLIKRQLLKKEDNGFSPAKGRIMDVDTKLAVSRINGPLIHLSEENRTDRLMGDRYLLKGEYLVSKSNASEFVRSLKRLQRNYPGLNFHLSGPQPPFNFISLNITRENTFEIRK